MESGGHRRTGLQYVTASAFCAPEPLCGTVKHFCVVPHRRGLLVLPHAGDGTGIGFELEIGSVLVYSSVLVLALYHDLALYNYLLCVPVFRSVQVSGSALVLPLY